MSRNDFEATARDIKNKGQNVRERANTAIAAQSERMNQSFQQISDQLSTYGNQIRDYLNNVEADIEGYRFTVEKIENGLSIDVLFKARIRNTGAPSSSRSSKSSPEEEES